MDASARVSAGTWPVWTLLIGGAAAAVFLTPALQGALIFDRAAIVGGQWWRFVTGNLVHHTTTHFIYDVGAFLVAGALIEVRRHSHLATLCLAAGAGIGAVLFIADPGMRYYGGLSGIVTATVVYLCLCGLSEASWWRWLCAGVLVLVVAKIGLEFALGETLVGPAKSQSFVPAPLSHVTGAVIALILFLLTRRTRGAPANAINGPETSHGKN